MYVYIYIMYSVDMFACVHECTMVDKISKSECVFFWTGRLFFSIVIRGQPCNKINLYLNTHRLILHLPWERAQTQFIRHSVETWLLFFHLTFFLFFFLIICLFLSFLGTRYNLSSQAWTLFLTRFTWKETS